MKEKFQTIKRKYLKKRGAFTLVELIVVMAVIAVLTLLAVPKFMGYTKEARHTKLITNSRELEKASERYFMDHEDWPRLTDEPYTAEQVHEFAKRIYDVSGKEVTLDPAGNYYDIDYDKLSEYIKEPDDKMNYVLRNPVGKVYALEDVTDEGKSRATQVKPTDVLFKNTSNSITVGNTLKLEIIFVPENTTVRKVDYLSSNPDVLSIDSDGTITALSPGISQVKVVSADGKISKELSLTVEEPFVSKEFTAVEVGQLFVVPETGRYKIELWGASGTGPRGNGGKGGYSKAEFNLQEGQVLYIYTGTNIFNGGGDGGQNPRDGYIGGYGGGASHIATTEGLLSSLSDKKDSILLVAGGGGGSDGGSGNGYFGGGIGGGANMPGGNGINQNGDGAQRTYGAQLNSAGYRYNAGDSGKGSFGQGGDGEKNTLRYSVGGGGGGGYYGGAGGNQYSGGSGGSGFANTKMALAGTILGTSGIHTGLGKANITFVGQ